MTRELAFQNRQRSRPLDLKFFRAIAAWALDGLFHADEFELGIVIVTARDMATLNERYLGHAGSTDVITFDYRTRGGDGARGNSVMRGELVLCIDDALSQARAWKVLWQSELIRYFLHGLLHLRGYDDHTPHARREMKREENRLLRLVSRQFDLRHLSRPKRAVQQRST